MDEQPQVQPQTGGKKRGFLLTLLLIFMLFVYGLAAMALLLGGGALTAMLEIFMPGLTIAGVAMMLLGLVNLAAFVVTIFVFMWKKWAAMTILALGIVVGLVLFVMSGFAFKSLISGLVGPGLFALLVYPKWKYFS